MQCIDKQIISANSKRIGGLRQHNPMKIHKYGFKSMVRAGQSGIIHKFFMYRGKSSAGSENCGAEELVLRLVKELSKHQNHQLHFNNFLYIVAAAETKRLWSWIRFYYFYSQPNNFIPIID